MVIYCRTSLTTLYLRTGPQPKSVLMRGGRVKRRKSNTRQAEAHDADSVDGECEGRPSESSRSGLVVSVKLEVEESGQDERDDGGSGCADEGENCKDGKGESVHLR